MERDIFTIPTDFRSILSTPLLSWSAKVQFSRLMIRLGNLDVGEVPKMSLTTWAENEIKDPMVRNIFYALCRTTTYTFAPTIQLASSVLKANTAFYKRRSTLCRWWLGDDNNKIKRFSE